MYFSIVTSLFGMEWRQAIIRASYAPGCFTGTLLYSRPRGYRHGAENLSQFGNVFTNGQYIESVLSLGVHHRLLQMPYYWSDTDSGFTISRKGKSNQTDRGVGR